MAYQDLTAQEDFWNGKELEVGATLEGKLVLIKPSRGPKSSGVMLIEKEDGTKVNVWMKTVIASSIEGVVKEGESIRLTYNGLKKTKDGADFHDYKVEVDR